MPILSIASTYWLLDKEIGAQRPAFYWEAMSLSHKDCTRKIITMTDLWYSGPYASYSSGYFDKHCKSGMQDSGICF